MPRDLFRSTAVVGLVVAVTGLALRAQQPPAAGRALAIEDYYRIQAVGSPSISPDGTWVSFTVSTRIEDDNSTRVETWVVPADAASAPLRLTHYGRDVSGARWSDDSRVEYTADRQSWIVDPRRAPIAPAKAGASRQGQAEPPLPSPDGKRLAAIVDKPLPPREPDRVSDFERRHEERFKGVTFDWKDFQRDGQPFPAPNLRARPAAQVVVSAADAGTRGVSGSGAGADADRRVLVDLDLRPTGLTWRPDGTALLFIADKDWRSELTYESPDLWEVRLDGTVTQLTDDGFVYSDAAYSPDGRYLSYVRDPGTDLIIREKRNHGGPSDLYIRPVAGGEPINLTATWDLEPGPIRWSPDSRFVYFTAATGGEQHLFRAAVPAGRVEQVTTGPRRISGLTFDKAFTRIAYLVGAHHAPPDVYVANIDGGGERRLTDVNRILMSDVALSKAERLQWRSPDGTAIEG
jgi:Tol biopolymer transport system component